MAYSVQAWSQSAWYNNTSMVNGQHQSRQAAKGSCTCHVTVASSMEMKMGPSMMETNGFSEEGGRDLSSISAACQHRQEKI